MIGVVLGASLLQSSNAARANSSTDASSAEAAAQTDLRTAILINSAATQAAVGRSNATIQQLYVKLDRAVAEKQHALRQVRASTAEARKLRSDIQQLRSEQDALMAQIARQDFEYKASLRAFREGLTGLFGSDNPRVVEALRRYSEGDVHALDDLQDLVRIIRAARTAGVRARNGADQRTVATLMNEERRKGLRKASQVLSAWQEAASVDPDDFHTWLYISKFQEVLQRLDEAEAAAKKAWSLADSPEEQAGALSELGDIAAEGLRFEVAQQFYVREYDIGKKIAARAPSDPFSELGLSGVLMRLGDTASHLGDTNKARAHYLEALQIRRDVQRRFPDRQLPYHELGVILARLALFELDADQPSQARSYADEAATIFIRLHLMNPNDAEAAFDEAKALRDLATVNEYQGQLEAAQKLVDQALAIYAKLYVTDADNVLFLNDYKDLLRAKLNRRIQKGEWKDAYSDVGVYVMLRRRFVDLFPNDAPKKLLLAQALTREAFVEKQLGKTEDQRKHYLEAFAMVQAVDPKDSTIDPDALDALKASLAQIATN